MGFFFLVMVNVTVSFVLNKRMGGTDDAILIQPITTRFEVSLHSLVLCAGCSVEPGNSFVCVRVLFTS